MLIFLGDRVIDVGSEWRTFSNDKATKDPSRVGDSQNPLLSDRDLSTMIGKVIPSEAWPETWELGNFAEASVTDSVSSLVLRMRFASNTIENDGCLMHCFHRKGEANSSKSEP